MPSIRSSAVRLCRAAGLHRHDSIIGGWTDDLGARVVDEDVLARLAALRIPPAWRDVWASSDSNARVQATGIDARGRTQYRYSAMAEREAAEDKFAGLLPFGSTLPRLRTQVSWHLDHLVDEAIAHRVKRATATVVRLIDRGLFRVGTTRYARDNHTYGLTTLTREHVHVSGAELQFTFIGKEHRPWHLVIEDEQIASIVSDLLLDAHDDEPVFTVVSPEGGRHVINSAAVNSYIHGVTTAPATARTFRTWGGTAVAAAISAGAAPPAQVRSKREDLRAYDAAAHFLGNTRAIARRSYVHPRAIQAGQGTAVREALEHSILASGTNDVRVLLHDNAVVMSLVDELTWLSSLEPLPKPPL